MSCQTCGREAENGVPTHYIGCEEGAQTPPPRAPAAPEVGTCEHEGCLEPKASKSPRAKWCEQHKDPKSREN
ncbi:hypothetical protein [Streptomyces sp. NPDC010273]|uniref:hypothetical protein n=1 Tax=Streptomyces sp. NPDC010273 TaxID=3364829 RepID=UPI0036E98C71